MASFIGGKVFETSIRDEAPREYTERRLNSLRETYRLSDAEARKALADGTAPDELDFVEWMVLLGGMPAKDDA